jgi:hypothetical protein
MLLKPLIVLDAEGERVEYAALLPPCEFAPMGVLGHMAPVIERQGPLIVWLRAYAGQWLIIFGR